MDSIIKSITRNGLLVLLVAVIGLTLAACGDAPTATPAPQATATAAQGSTDTPAQNTPATSDSNSGSNGEVQEVQVTLKEWAIEPANIEVKPGKVRFVVTNAGQASHNLTVLSGSSTLGATPTFMGGESPKTFEVDFQAGSYDMLCSLPGHAARGQKGTITVK